MEIIKVVKLETGDVTVGPDDIKAWAKVIDFTKKHKYGIIELTIENGRPTIGKWAPTINFKP